MNTCPHCGESINCAAILGQSTSDAKKAAARANGSAPVKPGSKPRGRPSKIAPPGQDR